MNEELKELPDHAHYPICAGRLNYIDKYCRRIFVVTCIISLAFIMISFTTTRIPLLALIPYKLFNGTILLSITLQCVEALIMALLAAFGYGRRKFCNVVLFVIYTAMTVVSLFSHYEINSICFIITGIIGMLVTFRSYSIFSDHRRLTEIEGYPYFNERFAYQEDHKSYTPYFENVERNAPGNEMKQPEKVQPVDFTGNEQPADMQDMPDMPDITVSAPDNGTERIFRPEREKFCTSGIKKN